MSPGAIRLGKFPPIDHRDDAIFLHFGVDPEPDQKLVDVLHQSSWLLSLGCTALRSFPPPALPGFSGTITASVICDGRPSPSRADRCPAGSQPANTSADSPCCVFEHSACIPSPLPRWNGRRRFALPPSAAAFPVIMAGRLPQRPFEACSVFTARYVCTVRWPAFHRPFLVVLQLICHLLNRSQCWRERGRPPGFAPGSQRRLCKAYTIIWSRTPSGPPRLERRTGSSSGKQMPEIAAPSSTRSWRAVAAGALIRIVTCASCSQRCPR